MQWSQKYSDPVIREASCQFPGNPLTLITLVPWFPGYFAVPSILYLFLFYKIYFQHSLLFRPPVWLTKSFDMTNLVHGWLYYCDRKRALKLCVNFVDLKWMGLWQAKPPIYLFLWSIKSVILTFQLGSAQKTSWHLSRFFYPIKRQKCEMTLRAMNF